MGDAAVEDIIAELEEPSFFFKLLSSIQFIPALIQANGWYLLIAGGLAYYIWSKRAPTTSSSSYPARRAYLSPQEIQNFESKEEARRRYVEKLQEKYNRESAEKAERDRIKEEEKRKARAAELEALAKARGVDDGQKLGTGAADSSKKSQPLRPEYNPLMGDTSSSRVFFRPSGGRQGG